MTRNDFFARLKVVDRYAVSGRSDANRGGTRPSALVVSVLETPEKISSVIKIGGGHVYILEYMKKQRWYSTNTERSLSH
jgi:hypothetical protein